MSLPLSRLDQCPDCGVDLHVCRQCRHYAPGLPDGCREDDAEEVRNKTAANFCDYFTPDATAFDGREAGAAAGARQQLDALFGEADKEAAGDKAESAEDALRREAEKLFGK